MFFVIFAIPMEFSAATGKVRRSGSSDAVTKAPGSEAVGCCADNLWCVYIYMYNTFFTFYILCIYLHHHLVLSSWIITYLYCYHMMKHRICIDLVSTIWHRDIIVVMVRCYAPVDIYAYNTIFICRRNIYSPLCFLKIFETRGRIGSDPGRQIWFFM